MPDREAPVSLAQHSFTAGEVAPGIYGRQDLAKYHTGCAVMRNWYVDPKGGATIRPGSQFIGNFGAVGYGRLIPFQFSPEIGQTYVLCFSDTNLRFVKNPGTAAYPNSSNAGFITSAGSPYEIVTPYTESDLRGLHYVQIADVMWLTCRDRPRQKLQRFADDNWMLSEVSSTPHVGAPTMVSITVSAAASEFTDPVPPVETRYMYCVSAVTVDGDESLPSIPMISNAGINIGTTQGTVTLVWTAVADAAYYKVYKALPTHGDKFPVPSEQFGFAGFSYGTSFTDSNIVADFAHSPIQPNDPFALSAIVGYTITSPGAGYPVGATITTVTDGSGSGAVVYPILGDNTAGATASIVGLYIANPGSGYVAPSIAAIGGAGAGFAATLEVGPSSGLDPAAVGLFQQRLIYASTAEKPNSIFASRSGTPDDFRKTNPTVASDGFEFQIFDQQVTRIYWMRSMPGGLLIGTNAGVVQLTGGSASVANPVAVTPTNAVVVPQSYFGSADIAPVVIDYNVLFVQREGVVRDLQYNFFANIYTGTDLTVMSNHLFNGMRIVDWAYQDTPNKIVWCIIDNGLLLSLTYLKAQEVIGWARHDTFGLFESVVTVQEGEVDAIYFSILRNGQRCIERQTQQNFWQDSDVWQLDSALSIQSNFPATPMQISASTGENIVVNTGGPIFTAGDVGKIINAASSRATITSYVGPTQVRVTVNRAFGSLFLPAGLWRMDPVVSGLSGLEHLEDMSVFAVVDGVVQGPFQVASGSITLTTPGSQVVVGLAYQAQVQPLYVDVPGETTIQGRRKKIAAASIRLRNTKGLKYGPSFSALIEWKEGFSSTDTVVDLPYDVPGLYTGDQRIWLDQAFDIGGWVCVQQDNPYPATILMIVAEMALGDAM